MSDIEAAIERLESGYYNSDRVTEENPGGMGDGGHVTNFPASLKDTGDVGRGCTDALADTQAARDAAEGFRDGAEDQKDLAVTARTGAEAARDAAEGFRDGAGDQKDLAVTARTGAETARDAAEGFRDGAEDQKDLAVTAMAGSQSARDASVAARDAAEGFRDGAEDQKDLAVTAMAGAEAARDAASGFANSVGDALESVVVYTGNMDFAGGLEGWSPSGGAWQFEPNYEGRINVALTETQADSRLYSVRRFEVDTSRKYRVRTSFHVGAGSGSCRMYVGIRCRDADGFSIGANSGLQYVALWGIDYAAGTGWVDHTGGVFTGEVEAGGAGFRVGTRSVELVVFANFNNAELLVGVDGLWLEDVTAAEDAAAAAAAAEASRQATDALLADFSASAIRSVAATQDAPPADPAAMAAYIVGEGSGAWDGWDGDIALWTGEAWVRVESQTGMRVWHTVEHLLLVFDDGAWVNSSALDADAVPYDNASSGLAATNVQSAIDEIIDDALAALGLGSAALMDYEEGTFTPIMAFVTPGNSDWSYIAQTGTYTRIGNRCWLDVQVGATGTWTSAANQLEVSAPFTAAHIALGSARFDGLNAGSTFTQTTSQILPGVSQIRFPGSAPGVSTIALSEPNFTSAVLIQATFSITYGV